MPPLVARASAAHLRLDRARRWLAERPPGEEVLIVAASPDAAHDLLRSTAIESGASFGWHRATFGRLAATLAAPDLAEQALAPVGRLACEAVCARAIERVREAGKLGRFAQVSQGPGFSRAVARTLSELRLARATAKELRSVAPELARIHAAHAEELAVARLADRADVFELAERAARRCGDPLLGLPTLFLDLSPSSVAEARLFEALAARAPEWLATLAHGETGVRFFSAGFEFEQEDLDATPEPADRSLPRLQRHLFEQTAPEVRELRDDVAVLSAPGEGRECVEIARQLLRFAAQGVSFDRMAVLLRSAEEYRPHLEEALGRAGVPAYFARGAWRPDPAGRALLALLACARERLSTRRFAEYLSLGEVPDATASGTPPEALPRGERWVPPDEELASERVAAAIVQELFGDDADDAQGDPSVRAVTAGNLRAPRHWERLLVDASVIGGLDRWQRRLKGLNRQLALEVEGLDDPDDPRAESLARDLAALHSLQAFALPLLRDLDALPERALWGEWTEQLSMLATRSLRRSERVLAVLAELSPMAEVGPVSLDEVVQVLGPRLHALSLPPSGSRYGKVFIAPAEAVRGLSFEVVLVPGLAERLFPRKISEDPILLDEARARLSARLDRNEDRVVAERLALRLAVGAASERVVLSYPRLDLEQSRPRVPSFYLLETVRAAEGTLPGFAELAARAETSASVRVGWPAPERPEDAIDEAEHDLALLERLRGKDPEESVGTARYLLGANPHLGRALRFRARRWLRRWTQADGLVDAIPAAQTALAKHAFTQRSYSATALQNYARCPYKFFLYSVLKLAPREEPEAIEELDPLQRGSLVHEVQFEFFGRLRDAGQLPVREENFERAREELDDVIDRVARRTHDDLAPAIERVWDDGIAAIRADLREWLSRIAHDPSGYEPWRFELSFGLPGRHERDPHSQDEPVQLDCGIALRGSIDLVERDPEAKRLRVTDHKTGRVWVKRDAIVSGGESLQPVLYALAMEKLASEYEVESGRLFYCTSAGGFAEREVRLDDTARKSAQAVADVIGASVDQVFLPAMPDRDACRLCDYQVVCGPYEQLRTQRKPRKRVEPLERLRKLP